MTGGGVQKFKPVEFRFGQIHLRGGHNGKFSPVISKTVRSKNSSVEETFVKFASSEQWLVQATTGQTRRSQSARGRTTLVNDLRTRVERLCDGYDVPESQESQDSQEVEGHGDDYDPMVEVDQTEGAPSERVKVEGVRGVRRSRYYKNFCKNTVVTVSMPARGPEQDPTCTDVRRVKLFIEDRKTVWLHLNDVPWAVQFLYVQNMLKGVPIVPPDSAGPGGALSEVVPCLRDTGS